jgi:cell wall assembly regulator SMI1
MEVSMPDTANLWQRLERWLAAHAPGDHAALQPGISDADLDRLEMELGFPLHPGVRTLLSRHDGVEPRHSSSAPGAFLVNFSLLGAADILAGHRNYAEMAQRFYEEDDEVAVGTIVHPQWVPIAGSFSGDALFVDHRPGPHYGEVGDTNFGSSTYRLMWQSQEQMLEEVCASLETGSPLRASGEAPHVHEGRMVVWD